MKKEKTKEEQIKSEKSRLKRIFKDIDPNKLNFVTTLIDRLAWLNVNIKDVEEDINEFGAVVKYDNGGGQTGIRENPNSKVRAQYTKDITTITKQLIDLVPAKKKDSLLQEMMND